MENNREQKQSEVLELKEKAKMDEEKMKDLQKQVVKAGKTNKQALAVAIAVPLLGLGVAGALAGGTTGTVMGVLGQVSLPGVAKAAKAAEIGMILLENQVAADFLASTVEL